VLPSRFLFLLNFHLSQEIFYKNNKIYIINGSDVYVGGNAPSDTFSKEATGGGFASSMQDGDMITYNDGLYVTSGAVIKKFTGTWATVYTYPSQKPSVLETHKGYLYFSYDNYKVGRINTSDTPTTSGAGSLDLALPGFVISFMKSDGNNLWIGLTNVTGGFNEKTYIYKWDGSTIGQAQTQHLIESRSVLSGCIVNGVPYAIDMNGRILGFNGTFFQEVARLPLKINEVLYNGYGSDNRRAINLLQQHLKLLLFYSKLKIYQFHYL